MTKMRTTFARKLLLPAALLLLSLTGCEQPTPAPPAWPEITQTARPWTRWWWMGSAVDESGLTAAMEAYAEAGLGGLEITPIYGVVGREDRFVDYLSDDWMRLLGHTLREAERLGLGIDMATGTGWPFGGPWVTADDACKNVVFSTYTLQGGERLVEPVTHVQEPMVRAVVNQVYELYGFLRAEGETPEGTMQRPPERPGSRRLTIDDLVEPAAANENLQALALEQVRVPNPLPLQALVAYPDSGDAIDLTGRVDAAGALDWTAPEGDWTLVAVFQGRHGKLVERAAPGGEGDVIDHFSDSAIRNYLQRFDSAFARAPVTGIRAFFNDSYEVDDARGQADWTPDLFDAFLERRGYDLRDHLPALLSLDEDGHAARVRSDYRATIADLLLERFTHAWRDWANGRGALVRNQAHGSPANILDLYAASDIPETEGTDLLRIKLASSASHVTGKPLTSAESATWLNEHFVSSLADIKEALDRYLVGGVNHVVYHGTNYSPPDEAWPGWLFYAAVHLTPANPLWRDFPTLNRYVARAQSFMQSGRPDNEVLLYFPIYDLYAEPGNERLEHVNGIGEAFDGSAFREGAETMLDRGFGFDFVSDRQVRAIETSDGRLQTDGAAYRIVVVPESRFIPLETFEHLSGLAEKGATVVFYRGLPGDVAGLGDLDARQEAFRRLVDAIDFETTGEPGLSEARYGTGRFLLGDDLEQALAHAGARREPMTDNGLQFARRRHDAGHTYFVVNRSGAEVDGWVPLGVEAGSAALFDPMREQRGWARVRTADAGASEVYVQLAPGESAVVQTFEDVRTGPGYPYAEPAGPARALEGAWTIRFVEGGPELPPDAAPAGLAFWTDLDGDEANRFSGTAAYAVAFPSPEGEADAWRLDLGSVRESAEVRLNGRPLGTLIGPAYRTVVPDSLFRDENTLEILVTGGMANRIADLDRRGVVWKRFYNVNFPSRLRENRSAQGLFDASAWPPRPSGLAGPVTLAPVVR